jgi:ubiquinone/menaquinone biosynthesis C-methylase UbiE
MMRPLQTYYAARAPEYDSVYLKPERQADLRAIEQWVTEVLVGARVLEIACGTGYWTKFIAQVAARVLALDAVPETIDIAKARVLPQNVEFLIGDAYAPPRRAGGFDAVFAGFWFSHVPLSRRLEFLSGLNAVVERDARIVLLDNRFVEGSSSPIAEQDAEGNTYQMRRLRDGTTHRVLKNFPSEAELRLLAGRVGKGIRFVQWGYYWALEYAASQQ